MLNSLRVNEKDVAPVVVVVAVVNPVCLDYGNPVVSAGSLEVVGGEHRAKLARDSQ